MTSAAMERAAESGRAKARERLQRRPPTAEQLRLVRDLLADESPRRARAS